MMIKVYVTKGLGIGCHQEVAHAYERAGAKSEIIHINQLFNGDKKFEEAQIINLCGGFLEGDILGAGICTANRLEHALDQAGNRIKDNLQRFIENGNIIYGQCNGFQVLVKARLLPGNENGETKQTVTLTHNDCGVYRGDFILHKVESPNHFAFEGIDEIYLWCRHGEGKLVFYSPFGSVSKEEAEKTSEKVNKNNVLLRYIDPLTKSPAQKFPANPNGSIDAIAGLHGYQGRVLGHMAHTEVGIYMNRDPRWQEIKDKLRRQGIKASDLTDAMLEGPALKVFRNIVSYFR